MESYILPDRLCLKNARLIDPALNLDQVGDLLLERGIITSVGSVSASGNTLSWNLNGAIICPGFFDLHVHLREPGNEVAETIRSGQESAAAGGFTAVAAMPNTTPPLDQAGVVRWVIEQASFFPVSVYPVAAITRGRKGEELTEMVELRQSGAIAFSDDGSWVLSAEVMRRALEYSLLVDAPIISHAEEPTLSKGGQMHEGEMSTRLGLPGLPRISEDVATLRDLMLAEYTGGRLHLAHVSTSGALAALEAAQARGVKVSGEATPHHLVLTDGAVVGYDTSTKMKPPLREAEDASSLWKAIKSGVIAAIATDHAPHTSEDKEVPYDEASFGALGLETAVALLWDHGVGKGLLDPFEMVRRFCHGPRAIVGLPIPALKEGAPVELTVFHPDEEWQVDKTRFYSKSVNSPFVGWKLTGRPWGILKGQRWAGRVEPKF
jgi:dihydroorotase